MIRLFALASVLALALAVTGCSTLSVQSDWDESVDFARFQTFKLLDRGGAKDQLMEKRIHEAVRISLIDIGFKEDTVSPSLLVAIHGDVKDKVDVQTYNYGYPYYGYPYWHGGQDVSVSQYQEGTLVIDFVDAEDNELVWRGWGTQVIDSNTRNPEVIQGIVDKIIGQYPPK